MAPPAALQVFGFSGSFITWPEAGSAEIRNRSSGIWT